MEIFQILWRFSRLSGNFPDSLEIFQTIRKFSRLFENFPDYSETFQIIRKLPRPFRHISDYVETFSDHPETLQSIQKFSRLSGNFRDYSETFQIVPSGHSQTIRKLSKLSGNFPVQFQGLRKKNFSDAQKLSGWQCHDAMTVFVSLAWCECRSLHWFIFCTGIFIHTVAAAH